jgi:DNA-binding transcriptional LysR family regulator
VVTARTVDLIAEGIDLALRAGRLADSALIARKLATAELGLYAAPEYVERRGRPRMVAALASHECVLYRSTGGRAKWALEGADGPTPVEVQGRFTCDELPFALRAAEHGLGIVLLPVRAAAGAVERGTLVRVLPSYRVAGAALYLVYPANRHAPRRVQLLRDFLLEALSE